MHQEAKNTWLFEGEQLVNVEGIPGMYKYFEGSEDLPLIVCIPGGRSNARIFYGVHDGFKEENFLVYWLRKKGYPVLCISYPLEMRKPIFINTYPEFTVRDWGRLIAEISKKVIEEKKLSSNLILIGWSAGGKSILPTSHFVKEKNLQLLGFVGLAATPPVLGLMPLYWKSQIRDSGHWHTEESFPRETAQILDNFKENLDEIEKDSLLDYYLGHNPVSILGTGWRYKGGQFIKAVSEDIDDNMNYQYHLYPLTASIAPSEIDDIRHSLTDKSVWDFVRTQSIYERFYLHQKGTFENIGPAKYARLKSFIAKLSQGLHKVVDGGNHCFFIGKKGAQLTAAYVSDSISEIIVMEEEFQTILNE